MFKEMFLNESESVAQFIADNNKYYVNGGAKDDGIVTMYVKASGRDIKQIDAIWFIDETGTPLTDGEQQKMADSGDYSYKRQQIEIKKLKNGWKTTKNTISSIIEPNQKLHSDDDVIAVLKQTPIKG